MLSTVWSITPYRAMFRALRFALAGWLALWCLSTAAYGQTSRAQQEMRAGLQAAAAGDTTTALTRLDRAIALAPDFAEAYFHRGRIYARRASAKSLEFEQRLKAKQSLEEAIRRDPQNPKYLLELGKLMQKQQIRLDSRRVLQRALDVAARADAETLAEVHYQLGLMYETQWRRFRLRHNLPIHTPQFNADRAFESARYAWRLLERSAYPGPDQGESDREQMLEHYRAALRANPGHAGAATHLLAYLYDEEQLDEYLAVARRFVRAAPSHPRAYLALGLGLTREAQDDEAAGAFRYALSLMGERDRQAFENVGRILSEDGEEEFIQLSQEQQADYQRRFWANSDPLYLSAANEFWLDYMARMTYVDIRFAVEEYDLRGWETDRGVIWLRYGEPERKATFSPSTSHRGDFEAIGKITTVWAYTPEGPVFVFRQNPGYRRATFANDFRFYAEDYRSVQPSRLTAPTIPERYDVPMQVVRFRGDGGRMDVEVHAHLPLDSLAAQAPVAEGDLEMGLFVLDGTAREVEHDTRTELVAFADGVRGRLESWRVSLAPDSQYLVGVEAREPLSWHAATARKSVAPKAFPTGEPSVSDVLLAYRVAPTVEEPERRSDFEIRPNARMTYGPDEPVALYFELYNMLPDEEQYASYELELVVTVEEIEREGIALRQIIGELADKWGFTEEGAEAVQLRFEKQERVLARDMIPEYFSFQLTDAPPGRYGLRLVVRDRNADREVTVEREFRITSGEGSGN